MEWLINLIVWLVVGGIIGWLASMVMGKSAQMGTLANVVAGILGSVVGGWIQDYFNIGGSPTWLWTGLFAILGAVIVIAIAGIFMRR